MQARKKAERDKKTQKTNLPKQLAHTGIDLSSFPFLQVSLPAATAAGR